jgi:ABC-type phosphate transport system ATPase subunit
MMQARRLSDYVAYMEGGQVLEYASTVDLFQNPQTRGAKSFVQGLIG